jgi:hypothetical protein
MTARPACPAKATGKAVVGVLENGPTLRTMAAQTTIAPAVAIPCEYGTDGRKTDPNSFSLSTECTLHLPFRLIVAGAPLARPRRDPQESASAGAPIRMVCRRRMIRQLALILSFTGVAQTGQMLDSFMTRAAVSCMTARDG